MLKSERNIVFDTLDYCIRTLGGIPVRDTKLQDYLEKIKGYESFEIDSVLLSRGRPTDQTMFIYKSLVIPNKDGIKETILLLTPTVWAQFQYFELIELMEARTNANQAKKFSQWSIVIALFSIITALLLSFTTQTVRVENIVPVCTHPSHSVHLESVQD